MNIDEILNMHKKAQKLLEIASRELTDINRALRVSGHKDVMDSALDTLAEGYALHEHIMNNGYMYPKEEK